MVSASASPGERKNEARGSATNAQDKPAEPLMASRTQMGDTRYCGHLHGVSDADCRLLRDFQKRRDGLLHVEAHVANRRFHHVTWSADHLVFRI